MNLVSKIQNQVLSGIAIEENDNKAPPFELVVSCCTKVQNYLKLL
jgi:hypothetical protein